MTDYEWLAMWASHCAPCAVFHYATENGVQYVFLPLAPEYCDDCGMRH